MNWRQPVALVTEGCGYRRNQSNKVSNVQQIDSAMEKINSAWQAASQEMYQAQQQAGGANPGAGFDPNNMGQQGAQDTKKNDDTVTDADFEEVK